MPVWGRLQVASLRFACAAGSRKNGRGLSSMLQSLAVIRTAVLATAPLALAACGGAGTELPSASYGNAPIAPSEEYTIGPLDEITIHVWRNPELSADKVRVRPDGRLTVPLVQDIPAVGKTATQLQEYIAGELTKYIEQPIVSVIVNTPEGNFTQQVRIIGATPQPASLPFRANMTVLDALIAVGGLNEFAAGNCAKLIRQDRESGDQLEYRLRLCQLARDRVTVALSGDGADEAFAGYRRQVFHHHEERARSVLPAGLRAPLFGALGRAWPKADWAPRPLRAGATLLALAESGEEGYARGLSVTLPEAGLALYSDDFSASLDGFRAEDDLVALMRAAPGRSGLDRAQYADLTFWMPGDILTKVDRTSMAASLEAREPLLDHRLVEFAARLPERMRVRGGVGKYLLKKALERYLSHDILYRPKQGFVTPIAEWLRGPLAGAARGIATGDLAQTGFFKPRAIAALAEAHIAGRADHSRTLWQFLMLEKSLTRLEVSA